jgi:hypothetical protein
MKTLGKLGSLFLIAVIICLGSGCRRSAVDKEVIDEVSKLPGASEVMAAIDRKDYDGAMAALGKVKEGVTTEEQNIQFMILARQARDKMTEAAATDPKAAAAVNALRAMSTGGR